MIEKNIYGTKSRIPTQVVALCFLRKNASYLFQSTIGCNVTIDTSFKPKNKYPIELVIIPTNNDDGVIHLFANRTEPIINEVYYSLNYLTNAKKFVFDIAKFTDVKTKKTDYKYEDKYISEALEKVDNGIEPPISELSIERRQISFKTWDERPGEDKMHIVIQYYVQQ